MARPLRIEFPGAIYHVTSRGNARQTIFIDNEDKAGFLDVLSMVVERFKWPCHAYCLTENHYHLLIETPNANLSKLQGLPLFFTSFVFLLESGCAIP
jgi:putative transposase